MTNKKIFMYSFAFVIVIRAIALCSFRQFVPYTELYIVFMLFWGVMLLSDMRWKIKPKSYRSLLVIATLAIYYVVFAFSNIAVLDYKDVLATMARSLMMVAFVCISAYWIARFDCLRSIIRMTYIFLAVFMTTLFFIYLPQTNLLVTISSFWKQYSHERHRNLFGFMVNNVAAEHALSVIILSLFVLHEFYPKEKKSLKRILILIDDVIMFVLILANNSRGTLVISVVIAAVYLFIKIVRKNGVKRIIQLTTLGVVAVVSGICFYLHETGQNLGTLLYFTNRMHFLTNYEILKRSGRWLMGLGRTSGAFLADRNTLYGMQTDYMEIFYASVFIQTGIIGSIWIAFILYVLGKEIYKRIKNQNLYIGKWVFFVFFYSLLISLLEDYILTSLYITSTFFLTFIMAYCTGRNEKRVLIPQKETE
jgi:hypothetical protein